MKLAARLRGFSDQELVEGGEPAQRQAQADLNSEQRLRIAMTSGRPELPRSELAPAHLSLLEYMPTATTTPSAGVTMTMIRGATPAPSAAVAIAQLRRGTATVSRSTI